MPENLRDVVRISLPKATALERLFAVTYYLSWCLNRGANPMSLRKETTIKLIRSTCVQAAASAMFYSGALNLLRRGQYRRVTADREGKAQVYPFHVLLYHRVNPDNDPFFPATSVKVFDAQMRYLAANYRVVALADIIKGIRQGLGVAPGTIAVTFDDGYRDNYVYAHPILRKYDLPATLFAATSYIGTDKLMWNDKLAMAMKLTTEQSISLPGVARASSLTSVPEKLNVLEQIIEQLKTLPEPEKQDWVERIVRRLSSKSMKVEPVMLSWPELRRLAHEGWEVGSHTTNHVILTRVPLADAKEEISSSSAVLQQKLDRPVQLFAYPNGKPGDYDLSIQKFLADSGYIGAVTTDDRLNAQDADLFAIGRTSPWQKFLPHFALKLQWSYWRHDRSPSASQRDSESGIKPVTAAVNRPSTAADRTTTSK